MALQPPRDPRIDFSGGRARAADTSLAGAAPGRAFRKVEVAASTTGHGADRLQVRWSPERAGDIRAYPTLIAELLVAMGARTDLLALLTGAGASPWAPPPAQRTSLRASGRSAGGLRSTLALPGR